MKSILARLLVIAVLVGVIFIPSGASGTGELGFLSRPSIGGNESSLQWIGSDTEDVTTFTFLYVGRWVTPNSPTTYNFGSVGISSITSTGLSNFTVTNNGQESVDIAISGTDMIGANSTWTLSNTATAGNSTMGLLAGISSYNVIVKKAAPFNALTTSLGAGASRTWGLRLLAPTIMPFFQSMSGNVTLTVSIS